MVSLCSDSFCGTVRPWTITKHSGHDYLGNLFSSEHNKHIHHLNPGLCRSRLWGECSELAAVFALQSEPRDVQVRVISASLGQPLHHTHTPLEIP
ncbi:hypothetical protein Pmani_023303 [Petrolisthes manimaculis]|uniref:Uncharacterized protein n=1 Tax=Petrolisthes manimaculis TaxID=1843537 RepID=A0AAE1PC62_9EUCA|nr:hypothetical protein Pmani_023303 [Petrolisthes manimaculis]